MRSRVAISHATTPQSPPVEAVSTTKSKRQSTPAAQPSGPTATDNEEKA